MEDEGDLLEARMATKECGPPWFYLKTTVLYDNHGNSLSLPNGQVEKVHIAAAAAESLKKCIVNYTETRINPIVPEVNILVQKNCQLNRKFSICKIGPSGQPRQSIRNGQQN